MKQIPDGFQHRSLQATWRNLQRFAPTAFLVSLLLLLQSTFFPDPTPGRTWLEPIYQKIFIIQLALYVAMWVIGKRLNHTGSLNLGFLRFFVGSFFLSIFFLSLLDNVARVDLSAVCITLFVMPVAVHMNPKTYRILVPVLLLPVLGFIFWMEKGSNLFWSALAQFAGYGLLSIMVQKSLFQNRLDRYLYQLEILDANAKLEKLATRDSLTGLFNRKHFEVLFFAEWQRSKRHSHVFSVLIFEMDHFKSMNETHGFPVGDEVLRQTGLVLQSMLRRSDHAARFGGEVFAILLVETDFHGANQFAERLRAQIVQMPCAIEFPFPTTISVGIAVSSEASCHEDLLQLAQKRLNSVT